MIKIITVLMLITASNAWAACETNVDKIKVFYINGMFTDWADFNSNKAALNTFVSHYLTTYGFDPIVEGSHNRSESLLEQVFQVARQKYQDADASIREAVLQFLNDEYDFLNNPGTTAEVQGFLSSINDAYSGILSEADSKAAEGGIVNLLDECMRVVMVTHSQGNFYGNAIFNDLYATYVFPNGYAVASYPMLGMMQIASPVYTPGGAAGGIYPDTIGHLTNNNDLVMGFVRYTLGSVAANYNAPDNSADWTGHSLEASYLTQPGQAANIANQMKNIAYNFIPYPMQGQVAANSSALLGIGYSSVNEFLDIEFVTGGVYRYENVPQLTFNGLNTAVSQGEYFNSYIRNDYAYTRLE